MRALHVSTHSGPAGVAYVVPSHWLWRPVWEVRVPDEHGFPVPVARYQYRADALNHADRIAGTRRHRTAA